jgi:cell division protein FtsQ
MKKWLKIAFWVVLIGGVFFSLEYAKRQKNERVLNTPKIVVHVEEEHSFMTEDELLGKLRTNHLIYDSQKFNQLNVAKIEKFILNMSEVKEVKTFISMDGSLNIDLTLREPIAHVFNKFGENFYIDKEGFMIRGNHLHSARVLVITGDIADKISSPSINEIINNDSLKTIYTIDNLYQISKYVCNDPLLKPLIGQIHRKSNGDYVLIPLVGGQKIIFGSARNEEEITEKFKKLKIFYKEAIPYEGWNKYEEISLKYDKQIVCKKKS